jgi:hypothetical protein
VNRSIPALLRTVLLFLPIAFGHSAHAVGNTLGIGEVSASDVVSTPMRATRAVAAVGARGTLDLRPPDLRSVAIQNLQEVATSSDSEETETVTIAAVPLLLEESDTHLTLAGIASLYWAARHPAQAWRVLLPVQLDEHNSSAQMRETCAASAVAQSGPVACP